jgi:hypothetical protein
VEETLNNSNDLFLTFRREMEEMSKKTKRLEKDNLTLSRKHELTNRNILEMAEERTKTNKEVAALRKKNANLESLCRGMQAQGRGGGATAAAVRDLDAGPHMDDEGTESDYTYDEEDREDDDGEEDEEGSEGDDGEYDEDTEEEITSSGAVVDGTLSFANANVVVAAQSAQPHDSSAANTPPAPQMQTGRQVQIKDQKQINGQAVVVNGTKH